MIISQNIAALNTTNNLKKRDTALSKSIEKLSSGFRINRASDDAAGLAVSESMRRQIGGLNQAVRNAQDGISLIQTAESALSNITGALQRIRQLILQKENGTLQDSDKSAIQDEINELLEHIESITNETNFNGIKLLDGSFIDKSIYANGDIPISIDDMDLGLYYRENFNDQNKFSNWDSDAGEWSVENGELAQKTLGIGDKTILSKVVNSNEMTINVDAKFTTIDPDGNIGIIIKGEDFNNQVFGWYSQYGGIYLGERVNGVYRNIGLIAVNNAIINQTYKLTATVVDNYYTFAVEGVGKIDGYSANTSLVNGYPGVFTAFAQASFDNFKAVPKVTLGDMDRAIEKITSERAKLGAYQNRLEHTINSLMNSSENLTASESQIKDVDYAKEITELTKNQIFIQAGQAMLAHANSLPETILQLLK